MANILDYMRSTPAKTALEANHKLSRNMIRKETREYASFLASAKETAKLLGDNEAVKQIIEDTKFICQWIAEFGIEYED